MADKKIRTGKQFGPGIVQPDSHIRDWINHAKKFTSNRPEALICFDNDIEFFTYINSKIPQEFKLSPNTLRGLFTSPVKQERYPEEVVTEYVDWVKEMRLEQQVALYNKLTDDNNFAYKRQLEILARRFSKKWSSNAKIEQTTEHKGAVNINFTVKD